jgi:hypothetical protein
MPLGSVTFDVRLVNAWAQVEKESRKHTLYHPLHIYKRALVW